MFKVLTIMQSNSLSGNFSGSFVVSISNAQTYAINNYRKYNVFILRTTGSGGSTTSVLRSINGKLVVGLLPLTVYLKRNKNNVFSQYVDNVI